MPVNLSHLTFVVLLPDFAHFTNKHKDGNFWTTVVLKLFPVRVEWYYDNLGNQYESH